MRKLSRNAGFF